MQFGVRRVLPQFRHCSGTARKKTRESSASPSAIARTLALAFVLGPRTSARSPPRPIIVPPWQRPRSSFAFAAPASTISRTCRWISPATVWWSSLACRARERVRWRLTLFLPRGSASTWSRSPRTRASFSTKCRSRMSRRSRDCRRPSPSSSARADIAHARSLRQRRRSGITCACSMRAAVRRHAGTLMS